MTVSETYGVISYGCGWRKDVVNQCFELIIIIIKISRAPIYEGIGTAVKNSLEIIIKQVLLRAALKEEAESEWRNV